MGLSMYLLAQKIVDPDEENAGNAAEVDAVKNALAVCRVDEHWSATFKIRVLLYTWRDANQIHGWFVNNVQDGIDDQKYHIVERDQLEQLVQLCNEALSNRQRAGEILPPMEGFFFGSTDIDEDYFETLEDTVTQITRILNDPKYRDWKIVYSCWW
jgi:hypothetical protein